MQRKWAAPRKPPQNMGHTDVTKLLEQTLENEKATDVALTEVAESFVNQQAAAE